MSGARALHEAWTPGLVVSAALGGGERREGGCHQRDVVLLWVNSQRYSNGLTARSRCLGLVPVGAVSAFRSFRGSEHHHHHQAFSQLPTGNGVASRAQFSCFVTLVRRYTFDLQRPLAFSTTSEGASIQVLRGLQVG